MADPKEPQSYGSQADWVTGDVGQEVNRLKGHPNSQLGDFGDSEKREENEQPGDRDQQSK